MAMAQETRGWWIILGVLVLIVLLVPLLGGGILGSGMWGAGMMGGGTMGPGMMGGGSMGPGMMGGGSMGPGIGGWAGGLASALGGLATLAFLGAGIVGIVLVVRVLSGTGGRTGPREDPALDVLKRRYAAGELTTEQYGDMRRALES